ncbi:MAG: glycosyltransferase [Lachnospiraceae bacterium]|nr:glycosyltransferase [Lachnospiraceae bacterium]
MKCKISVITVCYNAAALLPVTMESVLAQDNADMEYIIEDGGSTDETHKIIESYREKFRSKNIPFKYHSEPDSGIYDAMNKAVAYAEGGYVNFMNAGDCFYSSSVVDAVSQKMTGSPAIIYGDCAVYEYGRFFRYQKSPERIEEMMPFSHQSVFARTDILREHPFVTGYRFCADYDFLLTVHDLGLLFADAGVVVCITTADGVSSVKYHDTIMETTRIREAHGVLRDTKEQLRRTERVLRLKQFVLDHFPVPVKKWIRGRQIESRGQDFSADVPSWFRDLCR